MWRLVSLLNLHSATLVEGEHALQNVQECLRLFDAVAAPETRRIPDALLEVNAQPVVRRVVSGGQPGFCRGLQIDLLFDEERLKTTGRLAEVDAERYAAVYYPGGYGLLFDLVDDATSGRIAAAIYEKGGVVGAVCHGPAALAGITLSDGGRLVADRDVTGFTHEEEVVMKTRDAVPFLVGTRLVEAGAIYRKKAAWQPLIVRDGRLITGQNPQSAHGVGAGIVEALADA